MRDLQILFWLRWRQFKDAAVYWLRVAGYQPQEASFSQSMYVLYLLGIGALWLVLALSSIFEQANAIGLYLTPDARLGLVLALPWAVLILQVFVMVVGLQSTPLKLSFQDMAYIAGSPINRSAPVILGFIRQVVLRLLLVSLILAFIAIVIMRPILITSVGEASVRAVMMAIPLVIFTWALGWLFGILRLVYPRVGRWRFLWLAPLLLIVLAYLFPDAVLWPGRGIVLAIFGLAPSWLFPFMSALALLLVIAFVWLGNRINMIHAVDESIMYARVQALGLLAWAQPRTQMKIRMQAAQAGRKPLLQLPKVQGIWTFITRAGLSYIRHPSMLLTSLLWGAVMTQLVALIIVNNLPVQLWIGWLLLAGIVPPFGLLHVYTADMEEPFLRQFLPVDGFQLLVADVILPLLFLILGAVGVWLLQGFEPQLTSLGILFIPVLAILLTLCGAYSLTSKRVLQTRILTTSAAFGAVILATLWLATPLAGFGVAGVAVMILSTMLTASA
jgi:hypothetical protein